MKTLMFYGEEISVEELLASVHPLRYLLRVVEIVEALNDRAFEAGETACASFTGNASYLAITWGDTILWDTEGDALADRELDIEDAGKPSLELCLKVLADERRALDAFLTFELDTSS